MLRNRFFSMTCVVCGGYIDFCFQSFSFVFSLSLLKKLGFEFCRWEGYVCEIL